MEEVNWQIKNFNSLTVEEYWGILYLRIAVFVVEQNCAYQEVDEKDKLSYHIFGTFNNEIIATSRILPPQVSYNEVAIGRVAIKKKHRGIGLADKMMITTLDFIEQHFGKTPIRISAQKYLIHFYQKYGFKQVGKGYLEDDIPHVEMIRA